MEKTYCNYCGSDRYKHLYTLHDALLENKRVSAVLVQCEKCQLVYQNPRPTIEEIECYYPESYDPYIVSVKDQQIPWLLRLAYQYGVRKRKRTVTRHKTFGKLLDVGCSTGIFLNSFQDDTNWQLVGVDVSEYAAKIAIDQYHLDVFIGTLEQAAFPDNNFDVITMWDVLEHLHDPKISLHEISRILKPDGVFIFRIPNLDSWDARLFREHWAGFDAPRHLYVFDRKSIRSMLRMCGFDVIRMSSELGSYPTFVLSVRFLLFNLGIDNASNHWMVRFLNHPIARLLSGPIFYLYGLGARGPVITVYSKKASKNV